MSAVPESFRAFRIHRDDEGIRSGLDSVSLDDLSDGEVLIRTTWSGINYKDALAATGKGRILKTFPLTGGIDVAGEVIESSDERFSAGDEVLVTGCELSEKRDGGYSEFLRLQGESAIAIPAGLSAREAMAIGTAGFTAALSIYRMEAAGQVPDMGPIVVTGASGGVGSLAINLLVRAGYEAHAITGKVEQFEWLEALGAGQCISRHDPHWGQRPLETARWAGAIDSVGGDMLAGLSRVVDLWGNIACCGMAGGHGLNTTVFPLILRGVSLLGISSNNCPRPIREVLWDRLANEWKPDKLGEIAHREVSLDELEGEFDGMVAGDSLGRTVVRIGSD